MTKSTNHIKEVGKEAWDKIQTEGLLPIPENFHVLYAYFEGKSPDIEHAIDMLHKGKKPISDETIGNIYKGFIDDKRKGHAVKKAGSQVYDTVLGLSTHIERINTTNQARGERLSKATDKIQEENTSGDLKEILDTVVLDTQEILKDNTLLAQELDKSKNKMMVLQQDLENIKKEAATDSLTGLLNRKSFDESLLKVAETACETKDPFSLLMIDIDHFKNFNDTYGHQVVDQVLKLVAATLKKGVKGGDIVSRYGGEEFTIILPDTPQRAARTVAEHLRKHVSSKDIINRGTGKVLGQIRLSVGVSEYKTKEDLGQLIERADRALYQAKNNGRDQVVVSDL